MNDPSTPDDTALREALRASIENRNAPDDTTLLQARVLSQWQLRHSSVELSLAHSGGPAAGERSFWPGRPALIVVMLLVVLALAWVDRADPLLEELAQPDVLSQMGLGEI